MKLALRISAIDLFSGVLRRFRAEIVGTGAEADKMQRHYDAMIKHVSAGMKALAVAGYGFEKLRPAVGAAMDVQTAIAKMGMILQHNTGITAEYNKQLDLLVNNAYAVTNATKDGLKFPAAQVMTVQAQLLQAGVPLSAIVDRTDSRGQVHHGAAYMTELLAETKGKDPEWVAQNIENLAHSFQIGPDQYGQIADVIAKSSQLGTGTLDQLFYNLDQSGAMAHLMGHMSLQQTAILMKDLAPYGESGGNEFNSFLSRLTGGSYRGAKWMAKSGLDFYDAKGNFIGLDAALDQIATRYGAGKVSQREFNTRLGRAFGAEGIKVLDMLLAPSAPGVKSYQEMKAAYKDQAGLVAQNEVIAGTQEFQNTKFQSGVQNLASSVFAPLVKAMTQATKVVNSWTDALAESARKHKTFDEFASGGAALGLTAVGGYAAYKFLRGGAAGLPFIKKLLRGGGSTAVGIAEGKLLEKVAGVTPVFVTNWPSGTLPFGGAPTPGTPAPGASAAREAEAAATAEAESAAATAASAATKTAIATTTATRVEQIASEAVHAAGLGRGLLGMFDGFSLAPVPGNPERDQRAMDRLTAYNKSNPHESYWQKWADLFNPSTWKNSKQKAAWFSGAANAQNPAELTVHLKIDQEGRVKFAGSRSNWRGLKLNVGHMETVP